MINKSCRGSISKCFVIFPGPVPIISKKKQERKKRKENEYTFFSDNLMCTSQLETACGFLYLLKMASTNLKTRRGTFPW